MLKGRVGIIGAGMMGSYDADIRKRHGYEISVWDKNEERAQKLAQEKGYAFTDPYTLASNSDVVVVSVPIQQTPEVIREYGPRLRPGAALVDLTSRKKRAVEAALESTDPDVEIVSVHYNFRPTVSISGKKVIMLPVRPENKMGSYYNEFKAILNEEGAIVKEMDSVEKHDTMMDLLQGLAHTKHMLAVETMRRLLGKYNTSFRELMDLSTAFFDLTFELDGRIVDGNPDLYIPLQLESEGMPYVLDAYLEAVKDHIELVKGKDEKRFRQVYETWKQVMGDLAKEASKKTDRIIGEPTGIEIYFEREISGKVKDVVRKDLKLEDYKENLIRMKLPSAGELAKLKDSKFVLAKQTFLGARNSKEGQYVFFINNKKHPRQGNRRNIVFSPFFKRTRTKQDDQQFRIQMYNTFHDPFLNLFDTWHRSHKDFPETMGKLVAYKVTQ